jgi:KipI family sensor histidine kinase inhibitor
MSMRVLPMGPRAVLVEDPDPDPAAWSLAFRRVAPPGVVEIVPAAATVLITCESSSALTGAVDAIGRVVDVAPIKSGAGPTVVIDVVYDGPDLDAVAIAAGLDAASVVRLHQDATYEVAFCGFAPGFAYLRGLPAALHLPRRETPRTRVPAGSVAIAHEFSAVYPTETPGGWHLLGRSETVLFDAAVDPPSVLLPGMRVRFEAS